MQSVDKVSAFVTRQTGSGIELLVLQHPSAGNQLPAGTVEENEDLRAAVLREVAEETGLNARIEKYLGYVDGALPEGTFLIAHKTKVYARPDTTSFDWAEICRGIWVRREREQGNWTQITYEETDQYPNPNYVSYCITGWVPNDALASQSRRHLFHLIADETRDTWMQFSDNHTFRLFWARIDALTEIFGPQDQWIECVRNKFGDEFR